MDLGDKVRQTIEAKGLLKKGDTIIVAVSGGPDSTALLHVLHQLAPQWEWRLVIAHMNHQFRGAEAEQEAQHVKEQAQALDWPFEYYTCDVTQYMETHGLSTQVAARKLRYAFLHRTAKQYEAQAIATGHHADDQAETILMRIVRGGGPAGLSGIPIYRKEGNVKIVRPLLQCYKEELVQYCYHHHLPFTEDSSNASRDYRRNQVRLDVMPFLQQWNERLPEALNQLGGIIAADNEYLEQETFKKFNNLVKNRDNHYILSKKSFLSLPIALQRRLIKLILNYLCQSDEVNDYTKIELVRHAILQEETPSLRLDLSGQHELLMEYDRVQFGVKRGYTVQDYEYTVTACPAEQRLVEANSRIKLDVMRVQQGWQPNQELYEVYFDEQHIVWPLSIRNRRQGDRMRISGLNGTKKVKDIFIDDKIPPSQRAVQPIVVDGHGQLLWIPGVRRADIATISDETTRILVLTYEIVD